MINIKKKEECCGCYSCKNICPKECISMEIDNEGFYYPNIDGDKCINCNLCQKVCPTINSLKVDSIQIEAYACKNRDEKERVTSSSGGVFILLCKEVINKGGVVFGASFDKEFNVIHTSAESFEDCQKFKGSKYVQSSIKNTYKEAKELLEMGRMVLFSGTSCQIKGLNLYLRKNYDNLITVDVICHGVPSPKIFSLYKKDLIKEYNSKIKSIDFRNKTNGWKQFSYKTEFLNNKIYLSSLNENIYMKGFLNNLYLRPSCYKCEAKDGKSKSDISLGDYWGVENIHPDFDDDKGVSLVIVNTKKGNRIIDAILPKLEFAKTDLAYAISKNPCVRTSVRYNSKRNKMFKLINNKSIEESTVKAMKITLVDKIINKINYIEKLK